MVMDSSKQGQNEQQGSSEAGGWGARRGISDGDPRVGAGAPQRRGFPDKTRGDDICCCGHARVGHWAEAGGECGYMGSGEYGLEICGCDGFQAQA
jgi:hypothetical protein